MDDLSFPITPLAEFATQLHELYNAFIDVGFNEDQALSLVITFLAAQRAQ